MANYLTNKEFDDAITAMQYGFPGNIECVKKYVQCVPNAVHGHDRNYLTLLHHAAMHNRTDIADYLLQHGAISHATDIRGCVPLHYSSYNGHIEATQLLLKYGADPNIPAVNGMIPVHMAYANCKTATADLLRNCLLPFEFRGLVDAVVTYGNIEVVQNCIQRDPHIVNRRFENNFTLLHYAAAHNRTCIADYLLHNGALLYATDCSGLVPLHYSCSNGHFEVTELLLKHGADPNIQDIFGNTPLRLAVDRHPGKFADLLKNTLQDSSCMNEENKKIKENFSGQGNNQPLGGQRNNQQPNGQENNQQCCSQGNNQQCSGQGNNQLPIGQRNNQPPGGQSNNQPPGGQGNNWPPSGQGNNQPPNGQRNNQQCSFQGNNQQCRGQWNNQPPVGHMNNQPPSGQGNTQQCSGQGSNLPPIGQRNNQQPSGQGNNQPPSGQENNQPLIGQKNNQPSSGQGNNQPPSGQGNNQQPVGQRNNQQCSSQGNKQQPSSQGYNQQSSSWHQNVQTPAQGNSITDPPPIPPPRALQNEEKKCITIETQSFEILKAFSFREELRNQGLNIIECKVTENNALLYVTKSSEDKILSYIRETLASLKSEQVQFVNTKCCWLLKNEDGNINDAVFSYFEITLKKEKINAYVIVRDQAVLVYARNVSDVKKASSVISHCIVVQNVTEGISLKLIDVIKKWTTMKKMLKVSCTDKVETYICTADALEDLQQEMSEKEIVLDEMYTSFFKTFGKDIILEIARCHYMEHIVDTSQPRFKGFLQNSKKFQRCLKTQCAISAFTVHVPPVLMNINKACLQKIADENHCCWKAKYMPSKENCRTGKNKYVASWFFPNSTGKVTLVNGDISDLNVDKHIHLTNDSLISLHRMKEILTEQDTLAIKNHSDLIEVGTVVTLHENSSIKPYKSRIIVAQTNRLSEETVETTYIVKNIATILTETKSTVSVAMPLSAAGCFSVNDLANAFIKAVCHIKPAFEIFLCCTKEDGQMETIADIVDSMYQKLGEGFYRQCYSDEISFSSGSHNIDIEVISASLVELKADVIICTVDEMLDLKKGLLSKHILQKAGQIIQDECYNIYPNGIKCGEIAVTSAGNLQQNGVKFIFYCALPMFNRKTYREDVEKIVMKCLHEAELRKCKSVAFPALGTGKLEYPVRDVATAMFNGLKHCAFNTHVEHVMFTISKDVPILQKVFSAERKRRAENKSCVSDIKRIVSSLIGTISGSNSQMKLNIVQEDDLVMLPSHVVDVHFSNTHEGNPCMKFSSDSSKATCDQLYFTIEKSQDDLQSFIAMTEKCFHYCLTNRISAICLHTSENPNIVDIEQIHKVAEILPTFFGYETNCIQEVYIVLKTIDHLESVKQKLLHKTPWISYTTVSQGNKSLLKCKIVWQEISEEDVPTEIALIGTSESVAKCKELMHVCICEERQKLKNKHAPSIMAENSMNKSTKPPISNIHNDKNVTEPMTEGKIEQKDDVSAVINAGIIKYLFGKGEINEWISKVKNKFNVNVDYDRHCDTGIVCGSMDAILGFENFLDNFFPNDPDQYKQKETDSPSKDVEQLNISKVDSAAAPVAAGKGQPQEDIQLHGANKNIPKGHSNYVDQDNKISIDFATSTAAKGQTQEKVPLARANKSVPKYVSNIVDLYNNKSIDMHTAAAEKIQRQKDIQLHGANKSIQNDHRNCFQDTPNEKQIDKTAGREKLARGPSKKLKLRVIKGSIIVCPVDCLIISCNFAFSTSTGIMKAVAEVAGNEFTKACQDKYKRCQLDILGCQPITAGKLGCKKIILVRGPSNDKFAHADIKTLLWQLQCAYKNALSKADELGFVSVALHAIGKDIWKTNTIDCVRQFIIAVECVKHDITNLEYVHFVEKQDKVYKVVRAFLLENGYDLGGSSDVEENYANPTPTGCDIQATAGKVEDLQVDAAVSTESQHIDGHGKIARAFLQLGNDEYRKDHETLSKGTHITTEVLCTKVTGGNIKCKYVLHAIVTGQNERFTWDTHSYMNEIRRTVCNILMQASKLHCTSVALPLIGIRKGTHYSDARQSSCTAIIEGMNTFLKSEKHCSVKHIVFCSMDETDVKMFKDLLASKS